MNMELVTSIHLLSLMCDDEQLLKKANKAFLSKKNGNARLVSVWKVWKLKNRSRINLSTNANLCWCFTRVDSLVSDLERKVEHGKSDCDSNGD
jgi:hypothetical protein